MVKIEETGLVLWSYLAHQANGLADLLTVLQSKDDPAFADVYYDLLSQYQILVRMLAQEDLLGIGKFLNQCMAEEEKLSRSEVYSDGLRQVRLCDQIKTLQEAMLC